MDEIDIPDRQRPIGMIPVVIAMHQIPGQMLACKQGWQAGRIIGKPLRHPLGVKCAMPFDDHRTAAITGRADLIPQGRQIIMGALAAGTFESDGAQPFKPFRQGRKTAAALPQF